MKKFLSLLLCACMLCAMLPMGALTASAAQEIVLFEDDFEAYSAGANISAKADTYGEWSQAVASSVSTIKAENVDDVRGKAAHFSHSGTSSGGPRLHKVFYFEQNPTNMSISYDVKTKDCSVALSIWFPDGSYKTLYSLKETAWTKMHVDMDFTSGTYTVYKNGTSIQTGKFSALDYSTLEFRFSVGVAPNVYAYLDNVKFTTTDNVDPLKVSDSSLGVRTPEEIMAPFADLPAAPELAVPAGKYSLFTYDGTLNANNGISTGTDVLWTTDGKAMPAHLEGKPLIRLTNDRRSVQYGLLTKKLAVGDNPGKVVMEYYAFPGENGIYVTAKAGSNELINTYSSLITKNTAGVIADGWNKIKAEFDFANAVCNVYVNDTLTISNMSFAKAVPANTYEVTFGVHAKLASAATALVDSFVFYQDNVPNVEGVKYFGSIGTNWDLVTEDIVLTEASYVKNLREHPRLLVNDKQALINSINNNPQVKSWYTSYKATADKQLDQEPYEYVFENGRNLKGVAGRIESRLKALGFAYLVEGDEAYVVRGIEEIRKIGTFPDWSNSSPILSSGIMYGVACFYDWCYDAEAMTPEVKAEILQIVKAKSLWQFVRSYDGVISAEIADGVTNRTTVANACGAAMAIAMADEEPALAQKLIDGAVKHVKQTVEAYSPDGAFAEGTSYWNYANTHMFDFLIEMDNAVVEGYEKTPELDWYYTDARLINTPKYWAYMHGPAGNFDFGDSSTGFSKMGQIYWISQSNDQPFYGWYMQRTMQRLNSSFSSDEAIVYFDPNYEYYNDGSMPLDKTFNASDLAQVASMRSSWTAKNALFAAIQGGDNKASHMAKSLGTFVLDANGKRFVKQIGHVDYAAIYPEKMYYMKRAEGNNTIVANPTEEIDQNPKAIARFIAHGEAENEAFTVLDMTETNDAFTDAKRGMFMTKGRNSIVLQDEIKTNTPSEIWWFAHTDATVELLDGSKAAVMTVGGEKMYVRITSGPADAVFTVMEADLLMPEIAAPDADEMQVYSAKKLAIHMSNVSEMTLAVEFIPLKNGEGAPQSFTEVKPISAWSVSDNTISVKRQAGDALVMLAGSPSVLAYEDKFLFDAKDATVAPFLQDGVVYVPASRSANLVYAKNTLKTDSITITRNAVTTTISENVITKNGTLYVPATALAQALGMQLYTADNGLVVFADKLPAYTPAQEQAIYDELNTVVSVNGKVFEAFTTDRTDYYVPYNEVMPRVTVSNGAHVTKTKTQASFTMNGKTYTFYRVDVSDAISKYNTVLGKLVSSDKPMGTSNLAEYMTDGDLSTRAAVKSTSAQNVTFTFELDTPHYMKEFILKDFREDAGSVMENVSYEVRLEDGTWVAAGSVVDLDASGSRSGNVRTNVTTCTVDQAVTAVRYYMENTDEYINYIYVCEFEAIGVEKTEGMAGTSTFTTYEKQGNTYSFTTEILQPPANGYLVCVLKKGNTQVGTKIIPLTGKDVETYSVTAADCDSIQIMLIESFFSMRILAAPEML